MARGAQRDANGARRVAMGRARAWPSRRSRARAAAFGVCAGLGAPWPMCHAQSPMPFSAQNKKSSHYPGGFGSRRNYIRSPRAAGRRARGPGRGRLHRH
eukprot:7371576-Prymnesium_polylepis.3